MLKTAASLVVSWLLPSLLALAGPPAATAGAWLEPERGGFVSSGLRLRPGGGHDLSAYAAYGVSSRLTFGVDIAQSDDSGFRSAHVLAFARLPLRQRDGGWQWALELGAGMERDAARWSAMRRLTLSAGRALDLGGRSGWLAFDLTREFPTGARARAFKLDGTVGLDATADAAPMLQVELFQSEDAELLWRLLPSLRWTLSPRRTLLTGVELRSSGERRLGLRFELWHKF